MIYHKIISKFKVIKKSNLLDVIIFVHKIIIYILCLSLDPERFRFARETTFGRRHLRLWSNSTILLWLVSIYMLSKYNLIIRNTFIYYYLIKKNCYNI